ncbi:hypothetical protein [Umezawaea sp.]|uniref:hypothetical protein n=1 Tax=Umezawaea sp. TaxID=1955258 RepID=UPI002ED41313
MRSLAWRTAAALLVTGLIVFLVVEGLERADQWASVFALFVALAATTASIVGRTTSGQSQEPSHRTTQIGTVHNYVQGDRNRVRITYD